MRLFVAIELGAEVLREAAALVAELRRRVDRGTRNARLTWATPDRMHLTLRFLGEVSDERASEVLGALRDAIPMEPFAVAWEGLGGFPPKGPPRVRLNAAHAIAVLRQAPGFWRQATVLILLHGPGRLAEWTRIGTEARSPKPEAVEEAWSYFSPFCSAISSVPCRSHFCSRGGA